MFLGNIRCFDLNQKTALREFPFVNPRHALSSIPSRSYFDKHKRTIYSITRSTFLLYLMIALMIALKILKILA